MRYMLALIERRGGRVSRRMRREVEAIYNAVYEVAISMEFSFFERFSEKQVREMVKVLQIRRMREGEVVCHKGEVGNEFFLIFHGAVDIFPVPGEEPVATYVAGETFGELALLHDAPRAATVVNVASKQAHEHGAPDEVRVPIIRVTEPEATSLPFFVVMRGKVRVLGTIAIRGKLVTTWRTGGRGEDDDDVVDPDAVRVFENIPLFELTQGLFYGQAEYLLGPRVRQVLPNVSLSNLLVESLEEGQTLAMGAADFGELCRVEVEFA
ncbi:hypothetical protein Pmar_PMAR021062 [Perkinsus marinus ATCC 50983]|uniref:Cyclic nucleotide-binding domain-containing protein n=1 Tax=Perkinsus marinus (strain ATCC 50983 / TXsc) TaxID=423536 RepID=C5KGA8_PERM5|nr:hypothetical protein Pmar_PMAR021062 [Perkinsus marinus ATCC 50983]EER16464.1 hypothetical protein Pmar_PMAR021062 [Perkinsus marinus ATCC 50983]|eukprot:XP_002784668.1 hypothetical protein Pmar_PMAR021062 [Perkinsus marinus ATCC 50983]